VWASAAKSAAVGAVVGGVKTAAKLMKNKKMDALEEKAKTH
jgi:hypothetical protein